MRIIRDFRGAAEYAPFQDELHLEFFSSLLGTED
jgi:hypothetical protein